MTVPEIVSTVMQEMCGTELKVSLAIAGQLEGAEEVRLSISDIMKLTGMAKQSVIDGLTAMLARGIFDRTPEANTFAYFAKTVRNLDQNGTKTRPKTVRELDRSENGVYENQTVSSRELDRSEKAIHLTRLKEEERRGADAPPPSGAQHLSSEERFEAQMKTGKDPVITQRQNAEHLRKLLNPATFRDKQVAESYGYWYETYPRELIEAVVKIVPRIAGATKKPARFVLVDILNDALWHLDPELERIAAELLRPVPKQGEVYEARVPTGPTSTILREVKIMRVLGGEVEVVVKQPSRERDRNYDFVDARLPLKNLVEFKRMARPRSAPPMTA